MLQCVLINKLAPCLSISNIVHQTHRINYNVTASAESASRYRSEQA